MPNDFLTLSALTVEIGSAIKGGKIEKIYQPEKDEITLAIHAFGAKRNLVISCNASAPRIHFSSSKKENPSTAPTFCMHLRKLISSGAIEDVAMLNNDRIICIKIISKNELKDTVKYSLIFEMMGRYSNIILISENNVILDAVKQVPFDTATKRCLLPSMPYSFPANSKIAPTDYAAITLLLESYDLNGLAKFIISNVSGLCIQSADELCYGMGNKINSHTDIGTIITRMKALYNIHNTDLFKPCYRVNENGAAEEYYITPYLSLGGEFVQTGTLSEAIEQCTNKRDHDERHRERSKHLYTALKKYIQRNEKKLQKANEKLLECEKIDLYKKYGELITCNLHLIKRGDDSVTVTDYYDEAMPTITIPLNKQLTPQKSAQDYYKRYNKLKRTLALIGGQIDETNQALEYAQSIDSSLSTSSSVAELFQIEEELHNIGALKKFKNTLPKSVKRAEPFTYEYMDYVIMVGKNNIQNDKLTFKLANGGDMWLHTLNYHGSHTIIFAEGREIPDSVIQFSCEITAFCSAGKDNDKVAVDYTLRRNVKRNPSGNVGMVTYTEQQTAYVKPTEHAEFKKS